MATIIPANDTGFCIIQGARTERHYRWKLNDVPQDITGAVINANFRARYTSNDSVFELSTATGEIALTNPTNGEFTVTLEEATTTAYQPAQKESSLYFDIEIILGGRTDRIIEGVATFSAEITRDDAAAATTTATTRPAFDDKQIIIQGATNVLEYTWSIGKDSENSDPVNIAGATIECHFRRSPQNSLYSHGSKIIFSGTGAVVGDGSTGEFTITLDAATTESFNPKEDQTPLRFHVEITRGTRIDRVVEGVAMFKKQVTF